MLFSCSVVQTHPNIMHQICHFRGISLKIMHLLELSANSEAFFRCSCDFSSYVYIIGHFFPQLSKNLGIFCQTPMKSLIHLFSSFRWENKTTGIPIKCTYWMCEHANDQYLWKTKDSLQLLEHEWFVILFVSFI